MQPSAILLTFKPDLPRRTYCIRHPPGGPDVAPSRSATPTSWPARSVPAAMASRVARCRQEGSGRCLNEQLGMVGAETLARPLVELALLRPVRARGSPFGMRLTLRLYDYQLQLIGRREWRRGFVVGAFRPSISPFSSPWPWTACSPGRWRSWLPFPWTSPCRAEPRMYRAS